MLALKESDDEEIEAYGLEELMSGVIGTITGKQFVANNKVQSQQVKLKKVLKTQRKIEKPSAPNFVDDGSGGDNLDEKTPPVAKKAQPNEATPKTEPKWRPIDLASSRFVVKDLDSGQWVLLFQLPPKKQKKVQLALHLVTETGSHLKDLKIEKVEMLGTNSDEIRLELEEDNKLVLSPLFSINLPNKEVLILQFSCDVFQYCLMDVVCYENH